MYILGILNKIQFLAYFRSNNWMLNLFLMIREYFCNYLEFLNDLLKFELIEFNFNGFLTFELVNLNFE